MGTETERSWLCDGVKEIERVVKAAMIVKPEIIDIKQERPGIYGVVLPGPAGQPNEIKRILAEPLWHNERLETPTQLLKYVKSLADDRERSVDKGVIYIGRDKATFHFDYDDRRNRSSVDLIQSTPWKWLATSQSPMFQKDFVRLLRITFAGCVQPNDMSTVAFFRDLKISSEGEYAGRVQKGSEALGKNIQTQIQNAELMPEEITLAVNVFENFDCRVPVRCAIEVEMSAIPKFELIPLPSELQRAIEQTLGTMQDLLSEGGAPTFLGSNRGD